MFGHQEIDVQLTLGTPNCKTVMNEIMGTERTPEGRIPLLHEQ